MNIFNVDLLARPKGSPNTVFSEKTKVTIIAQNYDKVSEEIFDKYELVQVLDIQEA
jgi:hypothetical protein